VGFFVLSSTKDIYFYTRMSNAKFLLLVILLWAYSAIGQKVSISSTYPLNLYEWVENPLLIVAENNDCKNIVAKVSAGKLTGKNGNYIFVLADTGISQVNITVGIKKGRTIKWIQEIRCRVRKLPTPAVNVAFRNGVGIPKAVLLNIPQVVVPYDFGFEMIYAPHIQKAISFSLKISRNDSTLFEQRNVPGDTLTQEMQDFIRYQCKAKDVLFFSDIKILLYKKELRNAENTVTLYLTETN
jgi:hypothetical protein